VTGLLDFLQTIVSFILAISILITVHEYGHYWVARKLGVKILRFSIGFGRSLWSRTRGEDGTEFVLAAIPLGGYVRMLDEREGEVAERDLPRAFNRQSLARRFAIVAAGPVFNFLFAIAAYWLMFVIGIAGLRPIVGEVDADSIAQRAGLAAGQEILMVEGRRTPTWESVSGLGLKEMLSDRRLEIVVDEGGREMEIVLDLETVTLDDVTETGLLAWIGLQPARPILQAVIDEVIDGGAAQAAGLQRGDRIISADSESIPDWRSWVDYVQQHPGRTIRAKIERDAVFLELDITPAAESDEQGRPIGRIGASVSVPEDFGHEFRSVEKYSLLPAFGHALVKTGEMSIMTLRVLEKIITGDASARNLSGPISIARYAGHSIDIGFSAFLVFLAIVSISLGILNLLPIPLLDGGHLMYYLIELVKGSPVSEAVQLQGQRLGIVLLAGLMGLALYNDFARLLE